MADNFASADEKKTLTETFKALDTTGDGNLSIDEIKKGYLEICGAHHSDLKDILDHIDLNRNGEINYKVFVMASLDRKKFLTEKKIEACFKLFDRVSKISLKNQKFLKVNFSLFSIFWAYFDIFRTLMEELASRSFRRCSAGRITATTCGERPSGRLTPTTTG